MSIRRWWPPLAWAALILIVSSTPATDLPATNVSDKLEHAGAYFVLAVLVVRSLLGTPVPKRALVLAAGISAFGAVDEWHQQFIPGRDPDPVDWGADSIGAAAGIAAASTARSMWSRRASLKS